MVILERYPANYLTFGQAVNRIEEYDISQVELKVLSEKDLLFLTNNIPKNVVFRNNTFHRLPPGGAVKRGFDVDYTDHIHEHDQYQFLLLKTNTESTVVQISDLINANDLLEP